MIFQKIEISILPVVPDEQLINKPKLFIYGGSLLSVYSKYSKMVQRFFFGGGGELDEQYSDRDVKTGKVEGGGVAY